MRRLHAILSLLLVGRVAGAQTPPDSIVRDTASRPQLLEATRVVGERSARDQQILDGIAHRMKSGGGTAFLPGNSWLEGAQFPSEVVRGARGFSYKSADVVEGRVRPEMKKVACSSASPVMTEVLNPKFPRKSVIVYVDGEKYNGGLLMLNSAVGMDKVLAMETYPDVVSAPLLWRTNDACAVIAVWTKR
ncbi:MAG: hypothetical protein V4550_16230 [Gemmatimonadota bacterium]